MAKLTISYAKSLAKIVDKLGIEKPKITSEEREDSTFHATIEVDLINWVSMGYRGPREFTGKSSGSGRRAIRKAARKVVNSFEKYGLIKINDFSRKDLKLWKKRVMDIAKICKEVVKERDVLEKNYTYLKKKHSKLLTDNARMVARISRMEENIDGCMEGEKGSKADTIMNSCLDDENTSMEFMGAKKEAMQ
ncbi:unnamed protein product [Urochloa decumbens]|uniref:LAGLIDADG homing endonuclease n=1 Tax=Urochloa decumbens TaxID=240449 RepID=A0ABC9AY96_9POAL